MEEENKEIKDKSGEGKGARGERRAGGGGKEDDRTSLGGSTLLTAPTYHPKTHIHAYSHWIILINKLTHKRRTNADSTLVV